MSIMFNEICINEEMLPKYTYIYILYIYYNIYTIYIYIYIYNDPCKKKFNSFLKINFSMNVNSELELVYR